MDMKMEMRIRTLVVRRMALFLLFSFVFTLFRALPADSFSDDDVLRLNPIYKLKRMSNGEVIIYEKDQEPSESNLSFYDFNADVLLAAFRNQRVEYVIKTMSDKYYLSDDECRRELKHAVNVLSEWDIVLMDSNLAAR
jgi:hypothetical protein